MDGPRAEASKETAFVDLMQLNGRVSVKHSHASNIEKTTSSWTTEFEISNGRTIGQSCEQPRSFVAEIVLVEPGMLVSRFRCSCVLNTREQERHVHSET